MMSSNSQVQYSSKETHANMKESALLEGYSPEIIEDTPNLLNISRLTYFHKHFRISPT